MLSPASATSTLREEFERFWLDAPCSEMPEVTVTSAASTLEEELEIELELALMAARATSTLDDAFESPRLDV